MRNTNSAKSSTSFVGRARELAEVEHLLDTSRLVTVMGAPGAGKTRLVSEAAARVMHRFPSGVFTCQLARVASPDLVNASVASALGFASEVQSDLGNLVRKRFSQQSALLVIDNCEHVRAAVAEAVEVLITSASELRVLTTSRVRLRVPGETAWMLPGLAEHDALYLLVDRVRSVDASFAVTANNRPMLLDICRRLGSLPLALELVAPRLALLPASEVCRMLDAALNVLSAKDGPQRQRTMAAAIDWSVALLSEQARNDLWCLGVFPATFDLQAATEVLDVSPATALDRLGVLRDSSLLVANMAGSAARFKLSEPIRQYAAEHLAATAYQQAVLRRHAAYVSRRAEWIGQRLLGTPEQPAALDGFEELLPDIRQAAHWSLDVESNWAVQVVGHTGWAWEITGRLREGEELERRALAAATSAIDRARLLTRMGSLIHRRTNPGHPEGISPDAIAAAREANDGRELAFALCLSSDSRKPEVSAARLDEAAAIAAETNDSLVLSWVHFFSGILRTLDSDLVGARDHFEKATEHALAIGDLWCATQSVGNLVYACLLLGDDQAARQQLRSVLPVLTAHPDWVAGRSFIYYAAVLASRSGRAADALRLVAAHRQLCDEIGSFPRETSEIEQTARALLARKSRPSRYLAEGARLSSIEALKLALNVVSEPGTNSARRTLGRPAVGPSLTRREREVVQLVAEGLTNREIAAKLFITERTAEGHVERIRNKLDVRSRAQAATWAVEEGLVPNQSEQARRSSGI